MLENNPKLKVLDLFSGILLGGFSLGLERTGGFETVAFCEIEEFPRKVLKKHWPEVPQFQDVRTLKGSDIGAVDVICGGYPCQPFSTAGKRRGKEDDRHLWPEFMRLVVELRPTWVIGENVAGHISMGLDDVLSDLEREGYTARTFVIPACAKGAHHRRDRCWTVAHSGDLLQPRELVDGGHRGQAGGGESCNQREGQASFGERLRAEPGSGCKDVANANGAGFSGQLQRQQRSVLKADGSSKGSEPRGGGPASTTLADTERRRQQGQRKPIHASNQKESGKRQAIESVYGRIGKIWGAEPSVGRVADGVPNRVDRLKALGNAVVPQIPEMIGHAILEAEARQ